MTPRGTAALVARLRRELSERDRAVLESLYRVRLLTAEQIARLHCADLSAHTRARRSRALTRRLHEQRLVTRLPRSIGGIRAGSRGHVYGLSGLGQAVLDDANSGKRRRAVWHSKPYFQDHMLAVSELYVRLVEACRSGDAELLTFTAEPACWRRFPGPGGQPVILKPDAYVRTGIGEFELASFVEVDLGTESLPTIQRKGHIYLAYWRSGLEHQANGVFPQVLWLAPSVYRSQAMANALHRIDSGPASALFSVTIDHDGPRRLTSLLGSGGAP
jgi:hypothetical protein